MNERNINEGGPENLEAEPTNLTLRKIASELYFSETSQLQEIERQAVENSKSTDSKGMEKFVASMVKIQRVGEEIVDQTDNSVFGLAQIGLMIIRAATLFESGHLEDCRDEIYDAITALDNMIADHPMVGSIIQRLEALYQTLKEA